MSNESPKPSGTLPKGAGFVAGIVLTIGGAMLNTIVPGVASVEESLAKMGIPVTLGITISTIGIFLILFPLVEMFFVNPLKLAINTRTSELEKTFSEVEGLRAEMTKMKSDYEAQLSRTEMEAREKIQAQVKEAQDLRASLMADAQKIKDDMVGKAREEIAREQDRLMNELRVEVVNLTLTASSKIIGENIDNDKNRKLVAEFIEKAEVPSA